MSNLDQYVEHLRNELDAEQVSILLYSGNNAERQAKLYTAGAGDPAPELADLETAEHLINGSLSSQKVERFQSTDPHCHLLCVPSRLAAKEPDAPERRLRPLNQPGYWLGIRGLGDPQSLSSKFGLIESTVKLAAEVFSLNIWRADPVTGLPDRAEYERVLDQHLQSVDQHALDLGLLLVAPKALAAQMSDALLQHASATLQTLLRESDQLYRYSDTTIALPLPGVDKSGLEALTGKVLSGLTQGQTNVNDLHWSVAALHCNAEDAAQLRSVDCGQRIESALRRCQLRGGSQSEIVCSADIVDPAADPQLSSIFTGEPVRDYRNMRLLWEVVDLIGNSTNAAELSTDTVAVISNVLDIPVGLYEQHRPQAATLIASHGALPQDDRALEMLAAAAAQTRQAANEEILDCNCHAFPVEINRTTSIVLLVADQSQILEACDRRLLSNLIKQLSAAIERLKIAEQETGLRESETRALRQQVSVLSQQVASPEPVFTSAAMQQILQKAQAWSPTDETILITGESGAGKEIMAARLHQLSRRSDGPMVTVDCAAIPGTLLESELFGKVKGAFTGADSASQGYARKADGGTLFLDEIGELPIELQAKLLRFVQEKQVSPVGSADVYEVNVRIIAATNRNLAQEVAAGRFRGDLMYRLQVLELHLPPLRSRIEDIEPLAQYFLDIYNQQYQRACTLTPAATQRLRSYGWPGNVRELKHSMLKACLECTDDEINPSDIGFSESFHSAGALVTDSTADVELPTPVIGHESGPATLEGIWSALQQSLTISCSEAVRENLRLPFGTWLTEAMVRNAQEQSQQVAKHGAALLGMPESTYRRQLERVKQADQSGLAVQHPLFEPNLVLLTELVRMSADDAGSSMDVTSQESDSDAGLVESARRMLLQIVSGLLPDQSSFSAALMGVTPPTYRRHLAQLQERTL